MDRYVSVILPLKLAWEPCYRAGQDVKTGDRVKVRFSGKVYSGVVSAVDVKTDVNPEKVQDIVEIERGLRPVTEGELELWRFVSEYYLCTVGEVYRAAYPAGKIGSEMASAKVAQRAELAREREKSALASKIERLSARLDRKRELLSKARKESVKETLRKDIGSLSVELGKARSMLAELTEDQNPETAGLAAAESLPALNFTLSVAQQKAADRVKECFSEGKPVLLQGVTGSGKTEIYMSLARETFSKGRNVLYLVPEIAVSRQLEDRLRSVFGRYLLAFHSKETLSARQAVASAVHSGPYVVIGTRSSLFLPHHDLGLVIVDEEQDTSYKQDAPAPRYNGRDTAFMLARLSGADILLGTATPSLESLYNCHTGRMKKVVLTERYFGSADSDVEIIDTIAERKKKGMSGDFSFKLAERIRETLASGGQVLLLRARRAYSPAVQCSECGDIPRCPHCNVPLSWHKTTGTLMCHYCGWRVPYDGKCAGCGGEMAALGAGTQKIEEEAAALFPEARIARLDSDVAMNAGRELSVIRDFAKGNIDILVGTQIITKGFDFGGISLVAVLQADSLLGQQDFRADEKAFQLLEQFRGRSGRRGRKGLFVIQTSKPDHPVYRMIAGSDEEGTDPESLETISESMLNERFSFGYPPFSRMVRVILKDSDELRLNAMSSALASALMSSYGLGGNGFIGNPDASVTVLGPYAPAIDRISDQYVRHIRVSLKKDTALTRNKKLLAAVVAEFEKARAYSGHIALDVDPA